MTKHFSRILKVHQNSYQKESSLPHEWAPKSPHATTNSGHRQSGYEIAKGKWSRKKHIAETVTVRNKKKPRWIMENKPSDCRNRWFLPSPLNPLPNSTLHSQQRKFWREKSPHIFPAAIARRSTSPSRIHLHRQWSHPPGWPRRFIRQRKVKLPRWMTTPKMRGPAHTQLMARGW